MSDAPAVTEALTVTVGDTLRNARMEQGWSVSQVADKLHLTAQTVESIENNQFERLPGITFARGYVRSYAKILDLDAVQLVKIFDGSVEYNATGAVQSIDRVGEARRVSRGMLHFSLFVVLLIILVAVYYAWHIFTSEQTAATTAAAIYERVEFERADGSMHIQTLDEVEEPVALLETTVDEEPSTDTQHESVLAVEAVPPTAIEGEQATAIEQTTVIAQSEVTEAEPPQAEHSPVTVDQQPAPLADGQSALQLDFNADSWLRIVDADQVQLYSGTKRAGEQLKLTGKPPVHVHLGNAAGVRILYNGEPVAFSSATNGGVARSKLGQ